MLIWVTGLLVILFASYIYIGKRASAAIQTKQDYFLMGRNLGSIGLILTVVATQIGGGTLLGAAEEAYHKGFAVLLYPLGHVMGLIVLGSGYGARLRQLNLTTISELFETIYKSHLLRKVCAVLSVASLFLLLVGQAIAARKFLGAVGLGAPWIVVLFWSGLVFYTVSGGLKAVVDTDVVQAIFVLFVLSSIFFFSLNQLGQSDMTALCQSFQSSLSNLCTLSPSATPASATVPWARWLFMPFLFMLIEQDMAQRYFSIKSVKTVRFASFTAAFLVFWCAIIAIYFGHLANVMQVPLQASVFMSVADSILPPMAMAFFLVMIMMAIVSTADSLICSISSNLVYDIPLIARIKGLAWPRIITAVIGMSSLVLGFYYDNIVSVMMFAYEISVAVLVVPVAHAVLSNKRPPQAAAFLSILFGGIGYIVIPQDYTLWFIPQEILMVLCSYVGWLSGLLLKRTLWVLP